MAFPTIVTSSVSAVGTISTNHTIAVPNAINIQAGDILLCIFSPVKQTTTNFVTSISPNDWTFASTSVIDSGIASSTRACSTVLYKIADTSNTTYPLTISTAIGCYSTAVVHLIRGANTIQVASAIGRGAPTAPPALSLNEYAAQDVLWLVAESYYYNANSASPTLAAGYSTPFDQLPNSGDGGGTWTFRKTSTANSETPGVFTYPSNHTSWVAWTIAIYQKVEDPAFPQIVSVTKGIVSGTSTSHVIALPSNMVAGNLLVVFFSANGTSVTTTSATSVGWNKYVIYDDVSDLTVSAVFWKVCSGMDRLTVNTPSAATSSSNIVYQIKNADFVAMSNAIGQNSSGNSPNLAIEEGSSLNVKWISAVAYRQTALNLFNVQPAFYTQPVNVTQASANKASIVTSFRNLNAANENPGAYNFSTNADSWTAWTVGVYKKPVLYPTILQTTTGNISTSSSSNPNYPSRNTVLSVPMPTGIAGSMIVVLVEYVFPNGFDLVVDADVSGGNWIRHGSANRPSSSDNLAIFYKPVADVSNVLTLRRGGSGGSNDSYVCYVIQNGGTLEASYSTLTTSAFIADSPALTPTTGLAAYLFISTMSTGNSINAPTQFLPFNYKNYTSVNENDFGLIVSSQYSAVTVTNDPTSYWFSGPVVSYAAATLSVKYQAPSVNVVLPATGNLSIKTASVNSIAQAVDSNTIGSKSLTNLSTSATKLYGLTSNGGSGGIFKGVLFEYDLTTGIQSVKVNFNASPLGSLPQGNLTFYKGKLYGLCSDEGLGSGNQYGTLFEYDIASGIVSKKYQFRGQSNNEGRQPQGSLTLYNDKLYGMTRLGAGNGSDEGCIFEYDPATAILTYKINFVFSGINGQNPVGNNLTLYNNKFYGMTTDGGSNDFGVIFEYDPNLNTYTKKIDLGTVGVDSKIPYGDLVLYSNNKFYGMTSQVNGGGNGSIFEWDPLTNIYVLKYNFSPSSNGSSPMGTMTLYNSKFYGLTRNGGSTGFGVLFEYDPSTNTYVKKIELSDYNVKNPERTKLTLVNGKLYGVTAGGLTSDGGGIFSYIPSSNTFTVLFDFRNGGGSLNGFSPFGSLLAYKPSVKQLTTNLNTLPEQVANGGDFENGVAPFFNQATAYNGTGLTITNSTDLAFSGTRAGKILKTLGSLGIGFPDANYRCMVAWARLDNPVVGRRYKASIYVYIPSSSPIAADDHNITFTITDKRYKGSGGNNYSNFSSPPTTPNTFETVITNTIMPIAGNKNAWKKLECTFQVDVLYTFLGIGYDENKVPIFLFVENQNTGLQAQIAANGLMYIDQIEIFELESRNLPDAPFGMSEFYGYGNITNTNVNLSIDFSTYQSSTSGPYRGSSQVINLNATNAGLFGNGSFGIRVTKAIEMFSNIIGGETKASIFNTFNSSLLTYSSTNAFGVLASYAVEDITVDNTLNIKYIMAVEEKGTNLSVNAFTRVQITSVWTQNTVLPVIVAVSTQNFGTATSI